MIVEVAKRICVVSYKNPQNLTHEKKRILYKKYDVIIERISIVWLIFFTRNLF